MIVLKDVDKAYGPPDKTITAADRSNLEVRAGEFVVVTGPSGSGKTTLLNLIGGMTRPDNGKIEVDGRKLSDLSDRELSRLRAEVIGFVFQFQSMLPTLTAVQNVVLPARFVDSGESPSETTGRARLLLEEVGLKGREDAYSDELSEGQKRRVCIARALINQPKILLCDEPTGDLDPDTENTIMEIIARANEGGTTVLMTTHNHALKAHGSARYRMKHGKIMIDD